MERFVVDASIAIAWVHPGQATIQSENLINSILNGGIAEASALWSLETSNALLVLERRGKIRTAERTKALDALRNLNVRMDYEA